MSREVEALRARLEELARDGARHLRAERWRRRRPDVLAGGLGLVARLAPLAAAVLFAGWLLGVPAPAWPIAVGILLACSVLSALVAWRWRTLPVARADALALWDRAAGLEDRLLAADEFLRAPPAGSGDFVAAAIEDAATHVQRARGTELPRAGPGRPLGRPALVALAALVLLLAIDLLPRPDAAGTAGLEETAAVEPASPGRDAGEEDTPSTEPPPAEPPAPEEREPRASEASPAAAASVTEPGELPDDVKRSQGRTGAGRSADASASTRASRARGAPSGQSQESQGRTDPPEREREREARPRPPAEPSKKRPDEEASGSTAGRGSSRGSSKNPAATDWSSKDQVTTPEDTEIEDDEETEDEEEEQEARGGVQPALRDRRPPVSRDLRIGFGNRPNPDANGRGGPSAPKKSRGVASLVLGVPIPDRIKGQPNAGKTKITQERIEPRAEEPVTRDAASRGARSDPLGRLGELELSPWMRALVRDYFVARRAEGEGDGGRPGSTPGGSSGIQGGDG